MVVAEQDRSSENSFIVVAESQTCVCVCVWYSHSVNPERLCVELHLMSVMDTEPSLILRTRHNTHTHTCTHTHAYTHSSASMDSHTCFDANILFQTVPNMPQHTEREEENEIQEEAEERGTQEGRGRDSSVATGDHDADARLHEGHREVNDL